MRLSCKASNLGLILDRTAAAAAARAHALHLGQDVLLVVLLVLIVIMVLFRIVG